MLLRVLPPFPTTTIKRYFVEKCLNLSIILEYQDSLLESSFDVFAYQELPRNRNSNHITHFLRNV